MKVDRGSRVVVGRMCSYAYSKFGLGGVEGGPTAESDHSKAVTYGKDEPMHLTSCSEV